MVCTVSICFQKRLRCACGNVYTRPTLLWFHANGRNIVALRFAGHRTIEMLGLDAPKVWPVSNYTQQVPARLWFHTNGRNILGPTMLRVVGQQCCFRLHGPFIIHDADFLTTSALFGGGSRIIWFQIFIIPNLSLIQWFVIQLWWYLGHIRMWFTTHLNAVDSFNKY